MRRRKPDRNRVEIRALTLAACAGVCLSAAMAQPPPPLGNVPNPNVATAPATPSPPSEAQAVETSTLANAQTPQMQQALLIRIETLLDRAHFSPGVIDGRPGVNLHNAIAAYAEARGLATDGAVSNELINSLTSADRGPVTQTYTITPADEQGPFIEHLPQDFTALARLRHLGYRGPVQEFAERFHMSEELLRTLNPDADFNKAGTAILVLHPGNGVLGEPVARVEVDKNANQVRVYNDAGAVIAIYPATVGSTERPAPSGRWAVKSVTFNPDYIYDPRRLTFRKARRKLTIRPGPNNPVGTTWIALTKETYGIQGSPDPSLVGKTASHGCVRLTNWDAAALGHAVKKGTPVVFVGQTTKE